MGIIGILLTILKVLGIILLSILGLLLIIILLFLFVPFVYKIRVKYVGKQLEAEGEVSFLFRLLRARAAYKDELSYEAKAAFFTLISSEKAGRDEEDGKEAHKESKAADVKAEDTSLKTTEAGTSTGITGPEEAEEAKVETDSKQVNNQPESIKQEDSNIEDGTQVDRKQEVCGQVNEENKAGKNLKSKKAKKQKNQEKIKYLC